MGLKDLGIFAAVLAGWFVLNRWVLPWFGVPTCMSGNCGTGSCAPADNRPALQQPEEAQQTQPKSVEPTADTRLGPEQIDKAEPETVR
jgi:hypothetical protein